MREMSVAEQRYQAVLPVIANGRTVSEVAKDWGVSRQTMHAWLARYEAEGLEGLNNRSHRPAHSPNQLSSASDQGQEHHGRLHCDQRVRRIRRHMKPEPGSGIELLAVGGEPQ